MLPVRRPALLAVALASLVLALATSVDAAAPHARGCP